MVWIFRIVAVIVLISNASAYCISLEPNSGVSMQYTWPLHVATIIAFGGMVFSLILRTDRDLLFSGGPGSEGEFRWLEVIPILTRVVTPVGAILLFVVLSQTMRTAPEGQPTRRDGRAVLQSHGRVVREISDEEYVRGQSAIVNEFAGGGLVFSWLAASVLWTIPTHRRLRVN